MFVFMLFSMICKYIINKKRIVKVTNVRKQYREIEEKNTGITNEFIS